VSTMKTVMPSCFFYLRAVRVTNRQ
jgi:hypothetical protein